MHLLFKEMVIFQTIARLLFLEGIYFSFDRSASQIAVLQVGDVIYIEANSGATRRVRALVVKIILIFLVEKWMTIIETKTTSMIF